MKKIPKAVLKKCEWGHDDYSLEIKNLPVAPPEAALATEEAASAALSKSRKPVRKFGKGKGQGPTLFDLDEVGSKGGV